MSCESTTSNNSSQEEVLPVTEKSEAEKIDKAIINTAIQKFGFDKLNQAKVSFDFRDKHYTYQKHNGSFQYQRIFADKDKKEVSDHLSNNNFTRLINGDTVSLDEKKIKAYSNSVNSVIYFAFLPASLNDPAVRPKYLGKATIKDQQYDKIKVTFTEEGGGDDFDDTFIYWFNSDTYNLDYLAYEYHTDGGGMRFREAFNSRDINGVRIQDYNNYKPKEKGSINIEAIDKAFEADQLTLLSKIELENVKIDLK